MLDVKIEDRTVEERKMSGSGLELMNEAVVLVGYVLDFVAKDEKMYEVLKCCLAETVQQLKYGSMREGHL